MLASYTYSLQNNFPNNLISLDRLTQEIGTSPIVIALDYITTVGDECNIWFKDSLSTSDNDILNSLIAAHSGEPLPYNIPQPVKLFVTDSKAFSFNDSGILLTVPEPRTGSEVIYTTHNFCDKCCWFSDSQRVVEEVLVDSGNHLTYEAANKFIIDMISGRLQDDDGLVDEQKGLNPQDPHGYQVIVSVDGYSKSMREPFENSGGDYEVIWEDGYVKFFEALDPAAEVKCSYSYATTSNFILHPLPGKNLNIEAAEADFTHDVVMLDSLEYSVWGYVDAFAPQYMYKRLTGYGTFVEGGQTVIGTGTAFTTEVTPGQYIRLEDAPPQSYMIVAEIVSNTEITLAAPYAGSSGTLTVACSIEPTGVYPSLTKIPLKSTKYKRFSNIVQEAVGSFPDIPPIGSTAEEKLLSDVEFRRESRGMKQIVQAIPFRYATLRVLSSVPGLELRIKTSHDRAFDGESATLTFYCTSHDL